MAFLDAGVRAMFDRVQSHALSLGLFDAVNTHEPKNSPQNGLTCAVWADYIGPAGAQSGLAATTALVVFYTRIYMDMLQEPQDQIDLDMLAATTTLLNEYSGDFDFDAVLNVRCIDLLGITGRRLEAQAGYVTIQQKLMRVMTITLPVIVNDAWAQVT
jgi:hypothetical protein